MLDYRSSDTGSNPVRDAQYEVENARPSSIRVRKEVHGVYARFQAVLLEAPKAAPAGTPPAELGG